MPTTTTSSRTVVPLAEIRARRMIAEIRETFSGDGPGDEAAKALAVRVAEQLRVLPAHRRRMFRASLMVSIHDLEGLIAALQAELDALADDLRTANRHSDASRAYGQGARIIHSSRKGG